MNRTQPFTFEEFKYIYSKVPRVTVEVVVKTDQGVLLTLRQKHGYEGQWHLPGGTVFYRESLEDAVLRIAQEELGVMVKVGKFIGYIEYFSEEKERGFGFSIGLAFLTTPKDFTFKSGEGEKIEFFKVIPQNTILEQKNFLLTHNLATAK